MTDPQTEADWWRLQHSELVTKLERIADHVPDAKLRERLDAVIYEETKGRMPTPGEVDELLAHLGETS